MFAGGRRHVDARSPDLELPSRMSNRDARPLDRGGRSFDGDGPGLNSSGLMLERYHSGLERR